MHHPLRLGLIYGSARPGRFCDTIAAWITERLNADGGFELDPIDPQAVNAPALVEKIERADAFIVATPEYNHSFPAPLKELIDAARAEWEAKPVAFVSYGGVSGGLRAVEHLRGVFAELHAVGIRDTVSFVNAWEQFDGEGRLQYPERAEASMRLMLRRLVWWSLALQEARAARPYGEAA
ncbi:NADPH-dependent FMN reductase [Pelagerythrobacter aerophilus]|uniref:NAD(P)H-dependent oxidoreductase n=1 Tax=Pelagerythrobacter aerophilus TaxID=2306995 RepID=A0A418NED3_9SPHN|nr:NADPH-dependent FMN reductase [Pelagerythrobacter aerophilus]RIV76695.1 NAD(P)H-dependent oxidoreductase [Pelagerythrobacter aerophilus]